MGIQSDLPFWIQHESQLPKETIVFDTKNTRVLEPFEFEKIDERSTQLWFFRQQSTVNWIAVAYLLFVYFGPRYMKDRKPYDLRKVLIAWNWGFAIFSFAGFIRMAPTMLALLWQEDGFYKSVCTKEYGWEPELFWLSAFTISKIFELVDTVFIVLRKAPLIFLHWYHHVSMMLFMFYLTPIADPCGRYNVVINYGIHTIMYSYYALKVSRIRVPKIVSQTITSLQMIQFIACLTASGKAMYLKLSGLRPCYLHPMTMIVQLIGNISYLSLFANFFIQTYFFKSKKKAAAPVPSTSTEKIKST